MWISKRYFARLHTTSLLDPAGVAGFMYLSSSAVSKVITRFWLPPFRFGNDADSIFVVRVLLVSSTVQVPMWAINPCTTAWYSSAVPWLTLLVANLGMS